MRAGILIVIVSVGLLAFGLINLQAIRTGEAPGDVLPGLELADIAAGDYNLTILVPDSFGRKYYSKQVKLPQSFQISRYEITIDQWNECFKAGGCSHKAKQSTYQNGRHPVTQVSWYDTLMFTRWLSRKSGNTYRLPTEEEWAYVAFAGKDFTKQTIDGLIDSRQSIQEITGNQFRKTKVVGRNSTNPWGVFDMTGAVWEWTLTCWFSSDEENQRSWTASQLSNPDLCANRVVQGEERAHVPFFVDRVYAGGCGTGSPVDHIGFRVVRTQAS